MVKLALVVALSAPVVRAGAEDWPRYRGPEATGYSAETGWAKTGKPKVAWKAEIGLGYSTIVVAGGHAFTTGHGSGKDTVYCLDAVSGKEVWHFAYDQPLGDQYFQGGTTGTPTFAAGKLFQVAREGEVFCLDATSGSLIWKTHLVKDLGYEKPDWGFSGAALIRNDQVLLNAGEGGVALRVADGVPVWQSGKGASAYSSPLRLPKAGRDYLLLSDKRSYVCVEPDSGKEVWRYKWMTRYGVNSADPIPAGDLIFISSGYGKGAALLEWKGSGEPATLWKSREMCSQMNPCVLHEGFLYGVDGNEGQAQTGLKCLELKTGKVMWQQDDVGHGAVIAADGHLLVVTEKGELRIAPASPERFQPTMAGQILAARCWTQPALSGGFLYARDEKGGLVAVDLRK